MSVTPEGELMILLECAEDTFPSGRAADFKWHLKHPGSSPTDDYLSHAAQQGWVTLDEVRDPDDGRILMRPRLAPGGQRCVAELNAAGVQPARAVDADDDAYP